MISASNLMAAVRHLAGRHDFLPECATCGTKVERVADDPIFMPDRTVRVLFYCHRQLEEHKFRLDDEAPLKSWPKRVFLRNWAGYTIRPERPAGRRMRREN